MLLLSLRDLCKDNVILTLKKQFTPLTFSILHSDSFSTFK